MATELWGKYDANITTNGVQQVVGNRCHIGVIVWHNDDNAARYMNIYNALAANVTIGSTTPDMIIQIGADKTESYPLAGQEYSTGFSFAITTAPAPGGTTTGTSSWVSITYT